MLSISSLNIQWLLEQWMNPFTSMMAWQVPTWFRKQLSCKYNCRICFLELVSWSANGLLPCNTSLLISGIPNPCMWSQTVAELPPLEAITKCLLVSDIAKTFDVLGWFSPSTVKMKILLQQLWELKVGWDNSVLPSIHDVWLQWRSELKLLCSEQSLGATSPRELMSHHYSFTDSLMHLSVPMQEYSLS